MEFILGSEKDFHDFVDSIKKEDKVGIFTHDDLDGITSAFFLEKILEFKQIKKYTIKFTPLTKKIIYNLPSMIQELGFTKCFFLDLNLDQYLDVFREICNSFDVLLIDHHTINQELKKSEPVLKSAKEDCIGYVLYLMAKKYFDVSSWNWLLYSTLVSEYSFTSDSHLAFIKKFYPDFSVDNPWKSELGKITSILDFSIVYHKDNLNRVYQMIKDKDIKSLKKASIEVEKEIERNKILFKKKAEYSPKKDIYFWYFNPKFKMTSQISNLISCFNPDSTFVFVSDIENNSREVKVSARNQNSRKNMKELLETAMEGFRGAVSGGHIPAAGGSFKKQDLNKFKENILG